MTAIDGLTIEQLRRRRSEKWRRHPGDVVPAFVAEMDFTLAPPIVTALTEAVRIGDTGYGYRSPGLVEALRGFQRERYGWDPDPRRVLIVADVMVGVLEVLRQRLPHGGGVIVNTPVYPPFFEHIDEAGCRAVEVPLLRDAEGRHRLDIAGAEAAFRDGAAAYLLCNPHNPTGMVPARDELAAIAELAERYGAIVISDEIHAPRVLDGVHVPLHSAGDAARRCGVAVVSASKAWNLPGLKCAQVLWCEGPMDAVCGVLPERLLFRSGNLGAVAAEAAYREGGPWLDEVLGIVDRRRRRFAELLAEALPQLVYRPGAATYLAWVDCRALGLADEPATVALERGGVALGEGHMFGEDGRGFVRVTLATTPVLLDETVRRMAVAFGGDVPG